MEIVCAGRGAAFYCCKPCENEAEDCISFSYFENMENLLSHNARCASNVSKKKMEFFICLLFLYVVFTCFFFFFSDIDHIFQDQVVYEQQCQRIEAGEADVLGTVLMFLHRSQVKPLTEVAEGGIPKLVALWLKHLSKPGNIKNLHCIYSLPEMTDDLYDSLKIEAQRMHSNVLHKAKESTSKKKKENLSMKSILEPENVPFSLLCLILPCLSSVLNIEIVVWSLKDGALVVKNKYKATPYTMCRCDLLDFGHHN